MGREIQVIARIEPALYKRLKAAKHDSGMTMKGILRRALLDWLERRKEPIGSAE